MVGLLKHRDARAEPVDVFDRLERMLEEWSAVLPVPRSWDWVPETMIRVDEYREDGAIVVRAELPGCDPEHDIEVTVTDGVLRIEAERREEEETEQKGYVRKEIRTGSFSRVLRLPEGVSESDITAEYSDGILTIRVPAPEVTEGRRIGVKKGDG